MFFYNENQIKIKHELYEVIEQKLVKEFINENDIVLELGARYGTVSCLINSLLNNKKNQVSVEPDKRVLDSLEKNKNNNNCEFGIVKGFISNKKLSLNRTEHICQGNIELKGYGSTFVEDNNSTTNNYTFEEIQNKFNIKFNTLVVDCEGFFEEFLNQNKSIFFEQIKKIIIEEDYKEKCNYDEINKILINNKFKCVKFIIDENNPKISHRVWIK
ncbi:MAG: hypothetical protein CL678_05525 [Bdellovibrionaceae bacterium]|nr:hypothetical protein [Pseudobdellovibrionaceae bacterium]|tara:strand:+ start:32 stop:676 length:645 start_codon:yes stop_codon:yes gene_type:complete